jgi:hypothetical protein
MPLSILWGSSAFQLMHQKAQSISKHVKAPEKLSVFFSALSIQRPCSFALLSLKVGWKIVEAWRFGDKCDLAVLEGTMYIIAYMSTIIRQLIFSIFSGLPFAVLVSLSHHQDNMDVLSNWTRGHHGRSHLLVV